MSWIIFLIPNFIWIIGMFYVLYQDKINHDRKILYLLLLNFIFMTLSPGLGENDLGADVIEIMNTITEFFLLATIVFWMHKNQLFLWKTNGNENEQLSNQKDQLLKKNILMGMVGLVICIILICILFIVIEL